MISERIIRLVTAPVIALSISAACGPAGSPEMTAAQRTAVADSIRNLVVDTYDLAKPAAVARLMSLYPDSGAVYSTSSGHVSTTRAELQGQIQTFWQFVGSNMRNPKWEWTAMHIDVLAPDAAVMTASYRIPHQTPQNTPHVIAGAWTAVFAKRGGKWVIVQEHLSDVPAAAASVTAEDHSGH
jgi:ketosteroid isomerase-like protein